MVRDYVINGIRVEFPYRAYPSQVAIMAKAIQGFKRSSHCLLESPTGSGKTLALLCASLAWQRMEIERIEELNRNLSAGEGDPCNQPGCCGSAGPSDLFRSAGDTATDAPEPAAAASSAQPAATGGATARKRSPPRITDGMSSSSRTGLAGWDDDDLADFKLKPRANGSPSSVMGVPGAGGGRQAPSQCSPTPVHATGTQPASTGDASACCSAHQQAKRVKLRKPKIYYGTRTHKQISQIVRELKKTSYKHVKMTVLGSRDHGCIHPEVSALTNKNDRCRELRSSHVNRGLQEGESCRFYYRTHERLHCHDQLAEAGLTEAWPLEDLVTVGRRMRCCPFYAARSLHQNSDIVFCPYNYLIEPGIRETMEIELKHNVLILDEAHNIEDYARDAASLSLQQMQIQEAIRDLERVGQTERDCQLQIRDMARTLSHVSQWIHQQSESLTEHAQFDRGCRVMTGAQMVVHLSDVGLGPDHHPALTKAYLDIIAEEKETPEREPLPAFKCLTSATSGMLGQLVRQLGFIYADHMRHLDDFRLTVMKTLSRVQEPPGADAAGWLRPRRQRQQSAALRWTYALHFWCLNPAVVFGEIGRSAHAVVVASGTLSPMSTFESELGTQFPIQLEASHVIQPQQVYAATVGVGPSSVRLNGTYNSAQLYDYQDELGRLLLSVCGCVPAGVLCFFPSYHMLDKLATRWRSTGLWDRIEAHKQVLSEPRQPERFQQTMVEYQRLVTAGGGGGGALLLAVCRGKLSEGIDFSDESARAVITVSIPFPNVKDVLLTLKRQYNDQHAAQRGLLRGAAWYHTQAYRALNQALGRCIRHRDDWGAIILVDERFQRRDNLNQISKWLRGLLRQPPSWSACLDELQSFTTRMQLWTEQRRQQEKAESADALQQERVQRAAEASAVAAEVLVDLTNSPPSHQLSEQCRLSGHNGAPAATTPPMSPVVTPPVAPPATVQRKFSYSTASADGSTGGQRKITQRKIVLIKLDSLSGGQQRVVCVDGQRMLEMTDETGTRLIPLVTRDGKPALTAPATASAGAPSADADIGDQAAAETDSALASQSQAAAGVSSASGDTPRGVTGASQVSAVVNSEQNIQPVDVSPSFRLTSFLPKSEGPPSVLTSTTGVDSGNTGSNAQTSATTDDAGVTAMEGRQGRATTTITGETTERVVSPDLFSDEVLSEDAAPKANTRAAGGAGGRSRGRRGRLPSRTGRSSTSAASTAAVTSQQHGTGSPVVVRRRIPSVGRHTKQRLPKRRKGVVFSSDDEV